MQQRKVLPGSVTFVSLVLRQGIRPPMKPTVGVVRYSIKLAACAPKLSKLSVFVWRTSRHVEVPSVLISSACFVLNSSLRLVAASHMKRRVRPGRDFVSG